MTSSGDYVSVENIHFVGSSIVFSYPCPKDNVNCHGYRITLPKGYWSLEAWGASGGDAYHPPSDTHISGGRGGYSRGVLKLTDTTELFLTLGGHGISNQTGDQQSYLSGGFNGGGNGYIGTNQYPGGSGGGSTDIRLGGNSIENRILVAGGGGGAGSPNRPTVLGSFGGAGGGLKGLDGGGWNASADGSQGRGANQTHGGERGYTEAEEKYGSPGAFFYGGNASLLKGTQSSSGGGGGGYYGGGGANSAGGGGGSGYIDPILISYQKIKAVTMNGDEFVPKPGGGITKGNQGNGRIRIRYLDSYSCGANLVVWASKSYFMMKLQLMTFIFLS